MKNKERLDKLLTERGLVETRNKAQGLIMSGKVKVNDQVVTKSGTLIYETDAITLDEKPQWAGRGANKLLKAFEVFGLDVNEKICADFGASTGGFTDVMLARGAKKIYAIDVGYGQLIWRLANDKRVTVMDRTNARYLTRKDFQDSINFAACDVSFISLKLILPVIDEIISDDAVVLIKPQFEAPHGTAKHGVIKDKTIHSQVLTDLTGFIKTQTKFNITGLTHSPIKGTEGNIEFLCHVAHNQTEFEFAINDIVNKAHENFAR